ncbi:hypothetical protein [Methylobacter sp.]|uniref:hypothetical protein n=1 Tax=Methylobacter sp. TaxID=2051955 RepID=UPI0025F1B87C|nr:hypothetical protein [Methylobacter sp.]
MKPTALILSVACSIAFSARAAEFLEARIDDSGSRLTVVRSDGATFSAPKFEDQDSFDKPAVSSNHGYVGWLALFPNQGASYSQPLYLVVLDSSKRARRFAGDFGMVFGWCFVKGSDTVVYRYQFPHGVTPIGFDMRRLKDGKLLRRVRVQPIKPDEDESQVIRAKVPAWTRCAQDGAAAK